MKALRLTAMAMIAVTAVAGGLAAALMGALPLSAGASIWLGVPLVVGLTAVGATLALRPFINHAQGLLRDLLKDVGSGHELDSPGDDPTLRIQSLPGWLRPLARSILETVGRDHRRRVELETKFRDLQIQHRVSEVEREHLEGILDSLRDAVLVTDAFNDLVMANEAAANLFGFNLTKAIHQPVDQIIEDREVVQQIADVREAANPSARRLLEHHVGDPKAGRIFEMSMSCMPGQNERVGGVVTILHDVTQEREISDMKTDFVSKASHELKTPLSSIKAYIEMLVDGEAKDEQSRLEFYQIIQNETDRLVRLIDSMLNISQIEAGIVQVEWEFLDMNTLIDEVVEVMTPHAQAKNISLSAKRSKLNTEVEADRDMIQQVITNLVSNAIKYTPEGGRTTVSTGLTDCDRSVLVSVVDTGLGIPPDALPQLFDKFYRINNYKRVAKGTGLGLNLVKQIVETVHNGEIGVESELGMGSKFWFTIPCTRQSRARK